MKKRFQKYASPIVFLDESTHFFRTSPLRVKLLYFIGTIPFIIALLFFWSDMIRDHTWRLPKILFISFAFIWMKLFHALYARELWSIASGDVLEKLTWKRLINIVSKQTIIHSIGIFLLIPFFQIMAFIPLILCNTKPTLMFSGDRNSDFLISLFLTPAGLIFLLLLVPVYAFFQNFTVHSVVMNQSFRQALKKSSKYATYKYLETILIMVLIKLILFTLLVNLLYLFYFLPSLGNSLLGIDNSLNGLSMLSIIMNSTTLLIVCCISFLCIDPIIKSSYVLRCFYSQAQATGEDLLADLRVIKFNKKAMAVSLTIGFFLISSLLMPLRADVSQEDINKSISETMDNREFIWRSPEETANTDDNVFDSVLNDVDELGNGIKTAFNNADQWIKDKFGGQDANKEKKAAKKKKKKQQNNTAAAPPAAGGGGNPTAGFLGPIASFISSIAMPLFIILMGVIIILIVFFVVKNYKYRKRLQLEEDAVAAAGNDAIPNIEDESVTADQLHTAGWLEMAEDLEEGDPRLALRALYLASLSFLGERNLIHIASFKSNYEYVRDLNRHAHAFPEILHIFKDNVLVFERSWYGMYQVSQETLREFRDNVERIKDNAS